MGGLLLTAEPGTAQLSAVTQAFTSQVTNIQTEYVAACTAIIVPAIAIWAGPKILRFVKKFFNAASAG